MHSHTAPLTPTGTSAFPGLIDAATLQTWMQDGARALRVVDCRFDLADPAKGRVQYAEGHITGACYAHLETDLSAERGPGTGRHPLPTPAAFARWLADCGITPQTWVVAYDASGGCYAARLWWMLRWMGHERVCLLDGGWPAWLALPGPISRAPFDAAALAAPYPHAPDRRSLATLVDTAQVQTIVSGDDPQRVVLDARAADRYAGCNETIDAVAGHIPGALNVFWRDALGPDERFQSPEALRQYFADKLAGRTGTQLVCQCGSGVTACHLLFALHLAGVAGAALYAGSWSEWITDPARPVRTGAQP